MAVVISLQEKFAYAIAINEGSGVQVGNEVSSISDDTAVVDFNGISIDLRTINRLAKAPLRRQLINKQLFSGQIRLDMAQPMSEGNMIMFKGGKKSSGKQAVAFNTIA